MMRLPAAAKMMVLPITMLWSIHTHADASIKFHAGTPVREVVSAPEFAGYGRLLFPADNRYWSGDSLGSLRLTWYSEIRPASTVAVVNRLRADVLAKRRVFFDIYTEQEKQADPRKRNTGLFFFRGTPGARFAVCNAGGGFMFVGAIHDSFPHALSLSERGINAFALIYRPGAETACEDLARAIRFIFDHAKELEVNTKGYSLDPPTYAICGDLDGIAPWQVMKERLDAMSRAGIPTRFRLVRGLGHGFGIGIGTPAEGWLDDALKFWLLHAHD